MVIWAAAASARASSAAAGRRASVWAARPAAGAYDDGYGDGGYPDNYGPGVQYSHAPDEDEGGVQTGRSVATTGDTCSTPVKACTLYNQSYVGQGCSCKVPGGRSRGRVTP